MNDLPVEVIDVIIKCADLETRSNLALVCCKLYDVAKRYLQPEVKYKHSIKECIIETLWLLIARPVFSTPAPAPLQLSRRNDDEKALGRLLEIYTRPAALLALLRLKHVLKQLIPCFSAKSK